MDLDFSEEQVMLRTTARDFLKAECPTKLARAVENTEEGYSPDLWGKMAEIGWMGIPFPEEYGGARASFLDLVLLLEEMGRALVPGPFIATVVCGGLPILHYGTEAQKKKYLPRIAEGTLIVSPAFIEPTLAKPETKVREQTTVEKDHYLVSGTRLFVPYAHLADWLLYKAGTAKGINLLLVDAKNPGVKCETLKTLGPHKLGEVVLDKVKVPESDILGERGRGQEIASKIEAWGALAEAAYIMGGLQSVLERAVDYAKQRVQFNRQIGSFQIIQHYCADMALEIDGVKFLTYQAAWKLSKGLPVTKEIAMAKARASDASRRVCVLGHKIHGGVGIIVDHDMTLYYRMAKAAELAFGDAEFHREIIAQQLGL